MAYHTNPTTIYHQNSAPNPWPKSISKPITTHNQIRFANPQPRWSRHHNNYQILDHVDLAQRILQTHNHIENPWTRRRKPPYHADLAIKNTQKMVSERVRETRKWRWDHIEREREREGGGGGDKLCWALTERDPLKEKGRKNKTWKGIK